MPLLCCRAHTSIPGCTLVDPVFFAIVLLPYLSAFLLRGVLPNISTLAITRDAWCACLWTQIVAIVPLPCPGPGSSSHAFVLSSAVAYCFVTVLHARAKALPSQLAVFCMAALLSRATLKACQPTSRLDLGPQAACMQLQHCNSAPWHPRR